MQTAAQGTYFNEKPNIFKIIGKKYEIQEVSDKVFKTQKPSIITF